MTLEQLVGDALHAADDYQPSQDLFAKVQRSIDEDAAHRLRLRKVALWIVGGLVAVMAYLVVAIDVTDGTAAQSFTDRVTMPFRALEVLVTAVMIALVVVLGPAIRRFGETYEREVFRSSPDTGARVLRLLDISYYLIFSAYILMTLVFDPSLEFGGTLPDWVRGELGRVGGLLLLMGILHVVLVLALPVAGLVFSANQRRSRVAAGMESLDPLAERLDKVITIGAWILAGLVVLQLVGGVLEVLLVLGASG